MVRAVAHGAEQGYDLRAGQRQRTIFGFSQSRLRPLRQRACRTRRLGLRPDLNNAMIGSP